MKYRPGPIPGGLSVSFIGTELHKLQVHTHDLEDINPAELDAFVDDAINAALMDYLPLTGGTLANSGNTIAEFASSVVLYNNGGRTLATDGFGVSLNRPSNDNPVFSFLRLNGVRNAFIQAQTTSMLIRNENAGSTVQLQWTTGASVAQTVAQFGDGVLVGSPTGGFKGLGTINATAVYDDNVLLTDYVFDAHIDGRIDLDKWDRVVPDRVIEREDGKIETEVRTHEPARRFQLDALDPEKYAQAWQVARKLPAFFNGPEQKSTGDCIQRLIETCEVQAVHIEHLRERIARLENPVTDRSER